MTRHLFLLLVVSICWSATRSQSLLPNIVSSPDGKIGVSFRLINNGIPQYAVSYNKQLAVRPSRLGLLTTTGDFGHNLKVISMSPVTSVKDQYELYTGKKSVVSYKAHRVVIHLENKAQKKLQIIFQVSNDGVGFRYFLPNENNDSLTIQNELTTYRFDTLARAFLQPMQVSKTGWERTNPAYEEHYKQNIPVTDSAPTRAGWVYPALFRSGDVWAAISESSVDGNYCATHLDHSSPSGEYKIALADPRETMPGRSHLPASSQPFYSPWRIIAIGSLRMIMESTLGTDLAKPATRFDKSFIKPGKASWSWIMSKDDSIVYSEQVRYIDFAAKMNWQYCLIDVNWDRKIGLEKIKDLARYAAEKKVGLLLWYNSAGSWNTVRYTPKNKLLTQQSRREEFKMLQEMGIKGVKIDFFAGDGQSVMQYYLDILEDAARYQLLVNFHGATLPRGWHRTYPHLITTEAVKGFEMITFNQSDADLEATHCALLPFTRNLFDPMDFTPMNLYKIPTRVKRRTTSSFELATSVLFTSGIQHFAESPEGMTHISEYVQEFLKVLPVRWDETRFIDGYPGRFVVLARRSGKKWYIAGINAGPEERKIEMDLSSFKAKQITVISDSENTGQFSEEKSSSRKTTAIMKASGGFVAVLE